MLNQCVPFIIIYKIDIAAKMAENYMSDPITSYIELKEHAANPDSIRNIPSRMEMYIMSLQVRIVGGCWMYIIHCSMYILTLHIMSLQTMRVLEDV